MKKPSRKPHVNELTLLAWLKLNKIAYQGEHQFCPDRRWRADYALFDLKILIEIEGGLWVSGRHNRAPGMIADMEKYNWATMNGWKVLRYTPQNLLQAIRDIEKLRLKP